MTEEHIGFQRQGEPVEGTVLNASASMATIVMAVCMMLQTLAQILIWIALI